MREAEPGEPSQARQDARVEKMCYPQAASFPISWTRACLDSQSQFDPAILAMRRGLMRLIKYPMGAGAGRERGREGR